MRRSKDLDNIFNECLERMLLGDTLEQCLERFPDHVAELRPLIETALVLKRATALQPRPEFREEARRRFQAVLHDIPQKPRQFFFRGFWQPRWAMVVSVLLAVLMAGGGTVYAASASMPDQPLYPVKIAVEQTWLALTPSRLRKAELYAKLTERRMMEIARMVDEDKPEKVEEVAKRVDVFLTRVEVLSVGEGGSQAVIKAEAPLPDMQAPAFPGPVGPPARGMKRVMPERVPAMEEAVQDAEHGGIRFDRRAQLKARMKYYAANHPARLRALLRNAPESALPALLKAIAVSENGYDRALRSLDEN
ncbi:MAG: hypothetical protein HYX85_02120 [Chloroflexi bacterium]|nr:hypothetical protein [Chloroflexota bacterium]